MSSNIKQPIFFKPLGNTAKTYLRRIQVLIGKEWPEYERDTHQDKAILAYRERASRHRRSSIQGREALYPHWYAS